MRNKIEKLNLLLGVVRKINELVIYEKNREILINGICDKLAELDGYYYSLIVLLDESKSYIMHSEAGLQLNSFQIINEIKNGNFPECFKKAFTSCSYFQEMENNICKQCFNKIELSDKKTKILRLEFNGYLYGILYLTVDYSVFNSQEEMSILTGIVKDLSYALYKLEVSEKKSSNNKIAEGDKLYRTITDNIRDGLIITDNDRIIFINRKICEIFGRSEEEITNLTIFDLLDPEVTDIISDSNNKKVPEDFEFWIKRIDGKRKFIRYRSTVIKNKKGSRLIVITNITGKKKNEEKILQQQEYFKQLFENSPLGIVILDNKSRILKSNPGFEKMFQYSTDETNGRFLKDLIMPDELKNKAGSIERLISTGDRILEETIRKRKDNTILDAERLCYPIFINNKVAGVYSIYFDITERKQAELAMKVAKEKAEESEKLKSNFLAQMSHEIRTPINSIINFINLIKEEVEDKLPEDLNSAFQFIDNGSRRLIRTIDLILNMSQVQNKSYNLEFEKIDLFDDVVKPIYNEFINTAKEKAITITLNNNYNDPYIHGDKYTISQVFQNLIDNAIKFTQKGNVDISVYQNEKGSICVDVTDTGIGISEKYLPKLFDPFSQEESGYTRRFEGNGLGLALVKKYIEMNNARIFAKSKKGSGSTFSVEFSPYQEMFKI